MACQTSWTCRWFLQCPQACSFSQCRHFWHAGILICWAYAFLSHVGLPGICSLLYEWCTMFHSHILMLVVHLLWRDLLLLWSLFLCLRIEIILPKVNQPALFLLPNSSMISLSILIVLPRDTFFDNFTIERCFIVGAIFVLHPFWFSRMNFKTNLIIMDI